jgi:hypothetical protein
MNRDAHLTGARVAAHKYPNPPLLDARCPGLRLEALRPLGGAQKCTWTYRYRTRERRLRQIKLGCYPQMGLSDARRAWDEQKRIRDDLARGDPRAEAVKSLAARSQAVAATKLAQYSIERLCEDCLNSLLVATTLSNTPRAAETKQGTKMEVVEVTRLASPRRRSTR